MMDQCTKVNGSRTKSMEAVFISGQMAENITGNGKIITCTEEVSTHGKTEECTKETTKMTENMDTASTLGMTASNMKVGGKMENNMVKAYIEKMAVIAEVSGKMARE